MKLVAFTLLLLAGSLSHAASGSIKCSIAATVQATATNFDGSGFSIESTRLNLTKDDKGIVTGNMWNPIATYISYDSSVAPQIGRVDYIENDKNYKPVKYKNTVRFDLYSMVNTETFGHYNPDLCEIKLMIPVTALDAPTFKAVAIMNCDQNGGTKTLDCTQTPKP